jgi:hypothetical protein
MYPRYRQIFGCGFALAHPHFVRLIVRYTEFVGLRGVIHERLGPFEVYAEVCERCGRRTRRRCPSRRSFRQIIVAGNEDRLVEELASSLGGRMSSLSSVLVIKVTILVPEHRGMDVCGLLFVREIPNIGY